MQWRTEASPVGFAHPNHAKNMADASAGKHLCCSMSHQGHSHLSLPSCCCVCRLAQGAPWCYCHSNLFLWGKAAVAAQAGSPLVQTSVETG